MLVKNTKETREIKRVAASMAVDGMYLSEEFMRELIKVADGEKTTEELRKEVIAKYKQSTDSSFPERKEPGISGDAQ